MRMANRKITRLPLSDADYGSRSEGGLYQRAKLMPILIFPNRRLRKVAKPVNEISGKLDYLIASMFKTMYDAPGIGLAAPQVGISERIIVADCSGKDEEPRPIAFLNPEVVDESSERISHEEGCLSLPGQFAEVTRPERVTISWLNLEGKRLKCEFGGLWSRCLQHEIDHLDGILFIDRISRIKREMVKRKLRKELRSRDKGKEFGVGDAKGKIKPKTY